jgi:branched-chain amino acid transport system ATP-binding protein
MSPLLKVKGLRASYGQSEVLRGIDFEIEEGSVAALLGANGAGKTTTLRAICGMVHRKGEITLAGRSIDRHQTEDIARLGVAHVPDGRGTFLSRTVEENLSLGAMSRQDHAGISQDMDRVYDYFPILKERRRQLAGFLSGGEQQMLAVGRALMVRPRLLLLDEPSFGLAPRIVSEIFEILRKLNRTHNVAILLVEQNATLALDLADHVYLLETGRVVFSGRAVDVCKDETIRRSYLGY